MGWIETYELSAADAERFLQRRIGQHPLLLQELATWVRDTGGPRQELDGTLASLVPLWSWCVRFLDAGTPGVPNTVRDFIWLDDGKPDGYDEFLRYYVAEALEAYVSLVVQRVLPAARWEVLKRGRRDGLRHRPVLSTDNRPLLFSLGSAMDAVVLGGWPLGTRSDGYLLEFVRTQLQEVVGPVVDVPPVVEFLPEPGRVTPARPYPPFVPGGGEVLAAGERPHPRPAGAEDAPPVPHELRSADAMTLGIPPQALAEEEDDAGTEDEVYYGPRNPGRGGRDASDTRGDDDDGDDGDGGDEDDDDPDYPENWQPLPTRGLHAALTALGFVCQTHQGGAPRLDRGEHQYLYDGQEAAMLIETTTAGGKLRMLSVQFLEDYAQPCAETPTGRWLVQQLTVLAGARSAMLLPDL
ncbi:hypothetical protein AB2L28_12025 [Kineococcus sp. TBRC 1896]|uniref:Uncharacterized protein n=1 Tax=Kineococcus mangrovi TaxID=1660183 RepID=A0ABV4I359_9ACTN